MRRFSRICGTLALLAAVACAAPTAAAAGVRAQAGSCQGASAYPPATNAMVGVSTTNPAVGDTVEVSGQAFCGDEAVKIYLNGALRATAHTDATGSFDPPVVVHGPPGDQTLTAVGASGLSSDRGSVVLHVHAAGSGGGGHSSQGSGTEALSLTGIDIALIIAIAVALLAAGTALAYGGRRRRSA